LTFKGRANGDLPVSHDLENVVDGRRALIDELRGTAEELRTYMAQGDMSAVTISDRAVFPIGDGR